MPKRSTAALCILSLVGALAACSNTTDIQRRYVDMRDECRSNAEDWVEEMHRRRGSPEGPIVLEQKDVNAQLATVFSDCMFEKGWTVATPPKERRPGESEQIEARQRAVASRVPKSDGVGIGPGLDPGRNMPNFRRLKYR